jgi:hypothetical protein
MKTVGLYLFLVVVLSFQAKAQRTDILNKERVAQVDSLLNEVLFDDDDLLDLLDMAQSFQFLYLAANWSNRTYYAGRENGNYQSNLSGQIYYMHSNGFYAGISGSWYSQLEPNYRSTIFSVGYGKSLRKHQFFRYRFSADYFLFHVNDSEFDPIYNSSLNAGLSYKSRTLGTSIDGSLLVGQEFGHQFTWNTNAYLYLVRFGNYNYLRLEPEISLYFGSEAAEFLLNEAYFEQTNNTVIDTYYKDVFTLLNTQLRLPLSLNWKNFDMQVTYLFNLPQTVGDGEPYPNTSFFRVSLGYIISL